MPTHQTSHTLIHRAFDLRDKEAWELLVQHYRRFILYILSKLNVATDDLEDMTQQVLIKLTTELPKYDRTRANFRTWLSRIVSNVAISYYRKHALKHKQSRELTESVEVPQVAEIEPIIEEEWAAYISSQAVEPR